MTVALGQADLFDVFADLGIDIGPAYPQVDWTQPYTSPAATTLPAGVVAFDLETGSAEHLWSGGPEWLRLIAVQRSGHTAVTPDVAAEIDGLRRARRVIGHNILGYDLPALARHHRLDIAEMAAQGRIIDTMLTAVLTDPPEGGTKPAQVMRDYSLDALAARRFGTGKSHDLKALARQFGGFDRIPTDHADYVGYAANDASLAAQLAAGMRSSAYVRREHRVAALAARIRANGFRVDVGLLRARLDGNRVRRAGLLADLVDRYGLPATRKDGTVAAAPHATEEGREAIVAAFADLRVTLPLTEKGRPSVGRDALDAVRSAHADNARVGDLVDVVSSLNGIRSVYETVDRCLVGDRVHPEITMWQASGRWSTTEPGLTVMGKRGGRFHEREVFLPEPGHVIISADLAQVDARVVAAQAQDPAYLDLFEAGRDSHTEIAQAVWGDPGRRQDAKVIGHGFNYGMGVRRLAEQCGSEQAAREFDTAMRTRFPQLVGWKQKVYEQACGGKILNNGFGRKLRCTPGREFTQAPALLGQSGARDVMMEGLLRLPAAVWPYLRAVIHDEVVLSVPADQADDIERAVLDALAFEWAPRPDCRPVRIEAGLGERRGLNWGHVYDKN